MRPHRGWLAPIVSLFFLAVFGCSDRATPTPLSPEIALALNVAATPVQITVTPSPATVAVGDTLQFTATGYDAAGQPISNLTFKWKTGSTMSATVTSTGLVSGVSTGLVRIRAQVGSVFGAVTLTVTPATAPPPPPPPAGPFAFCTPAGANCDFIGLRDVRLVASSGAFVQATAYHTIPCATYGFGNQNPGPGQQQWCEYGPLQTTSLTNPMPGMAGLPATVVVALGSPGVALPQSRAAYGAPGSTPGQGSFRTTCSLSTYRFDDPIVFPGQAGASHLHMFFGNTAIDAYTTSQSLESSGNSTCRGGTLNRSAYWVPALFDTRTGATVTPDEAVIYYKTGYNMPPTAIQPIPAGLRMIAGSKAATSVQTYVEWVCRDLSTPNTGTVPTVCPVGDAVRLIVTFPQCWDGTNLDSPDHQSHMAYPLYRNQPQWSGCPPTHPIALPAITEHFDFPVTDVTDAAFWRLTSDMYASSLQGGLSGHADWMNGWDQTTMATIVTQCLNKAKDCGVGGIGNGMELY